MRPLPTLLALAALTGLAVLLVAGHGPWSGPTLWSVTGSHGVNVGDLAVAALWLLGTATVLVSASRR